jgi:hypothetical protein
MRICLLLSMFLPAHLLFAQATVEGAVAAGAAATASAPARSVGKNINGLAGKLDEILKGAAGESSGGTTQQSVRTTSTKGTSLPAPKPGAKFEDAAGIEAGMTGEEVLRRFGPPNLQITDGSERSLLYSGKSGKVRVHIQDGKVASVEKATS